MTRPAQDIELVALIRPGSALARSWKLAKPTYGIYQYDKAFDRHELRFGDGAWQNLEPEHIPDLVLLEAYGTELVERLFDD
ncbi:hypothetical protein B2G71_19345 [Novosphingobium sp. PC22D]|uniref:Uncharacterized protein n=2 Tax=Novosphingobium TaxID=165696 RepID=A0ABQ2JTZ5_9SPHN|nr:MULTISPECIES: hypothetical protein [Novosphingobium]MCJ2180123.1 hypothetical protein [Novosphingobium album (ex Hu et al. 2023)]PEQ10975.1 hypothetical protein B2G71_19345 [Novosphingobium sp. PC22D]GGN55897.1 hypothetical protein GCM10011349_33050 [Novosphingobium indicum]